MGEPGGLLMSFMLLMLLMSGVVIYALLSMYLKLKKKRTEREDTSQVGFVVDTFHELVAKLKEKETELEDMRRLAEDRADTIEDYNENILQSVPSGVVSMDGEWKIVKANAAAESILGAGIAELSGRDGRDALGRLMEGVSDARGERITRGECDYETPSGKRLRLGFSLTPLKDASGTEIGHLMVFTDLTELRALETQAALRQRLSSLGEMAAGIAHELRNSMGAISGYIRLLRKKSNPDAMETVEKVSSEVGVMDRIVSDFLAFARPGEPSLSRVDLGPLVDECVDALRPEDGKVDMSAKSDGQVTALVDEVLMRQSIKNLIQNALHATPAGGSVTATLSEEGGSAVIRVSDTGHGIGPSIRDRIFDPFYTTKDKGTGLGLAIVHRCVTSLGGTVDVESSHEGTTFTLTLPLAPEKKA
jgi:PAS domain S-box-containing protein